MKANKARPPVFPVEKSWTLANLFYITLTKGARYYNSGRFYYTLSDIHFTIKVFHMIHVTHLLIINITNNPSLGGSRSWNDRIILLRIIMNKKDFKIVKYVYTNWKMPNRKIIWFNNSFGISTAVYFSDNWKRWNIPKWNKRLLMDQRKCRYSPYFIYI